MPSRRYPIPAALLLAAALSARAAPAPPASGASAPASAACPGRAVSAPQDAARASSKLRHMPDEGDPCASSLGLGRPLRRLDAASAPN